jgi:hypothetical protein
VKELLMAVQKCQTIYSNACTPVPSNKIWGYLGRKGFRNQVEKDWLILKPGETMVGRVVTAQFMPSRPDLDTLSG